eukprot:11062984-Alexandrium_andersonii.AAC.1
MCSAQEFNVELLSRCRRRAEMARTRRNATGPAHWHTGCCPIPCRRPWSKSCQGLPHSSSSMQHTHTQR